MLRISSSIWSDASAWQSVKLVDRRGIGLLRYLHRIWRAADACDVIILNGALGWGDRYCDLLAALIIKLKRRRPWVILTDCTWEFGSKALLRRAPFLAAIFPYVSKWIIRNIDHSKQIYCVLSSDEKRDFGRLWNVDPGRVRFTPYCNTLFGDDESSNDAGYAFAGGNSLRDYSLLIEAFSQIDMPLRIASSFVPEVAVPNIISRKLPHSEYIEEMKAASLVVVTLQISQRSAGQQTYLNAMALGKLVIVNDAPGVRDYIEHGVTGLIVDSKASAIIASVVWFQDPENHISVEKIKENARRVAIQKFGLDDYLESLLGVSEQLVE